MVVIFGLNLRAFQKFFFLFKNICDIMEIRVKEVSFMMELRCIFWNFDLCFFGLNFTGNKSVVWLTKLLQRIFLSYLKYKIKIIERISIYFLVNSILSSNTSFVCFRTWCTYIGGQKSTVVVPLGWSYAPQGTHMCSSM